MSKLEITQKELDDKISAAVFEATEGLKRKNKELIGDLSKFKDIDLDQLLSDQKELKTLREKSQKEKGDWEKLYNDLKTSADTERSKLSTEVQDLRSKLINTQRDHVLSSVIASSGVLPPYVDTVRKLLSSDVVAKEDGTGFLIQGKEVQQYVDEWKQTDVGKVFFDEGNRGGGATGDGGANTIPEAEYFKKGSPNYNLTKQVEIKRKDPALYERLKKSS